MTNKKPLIKLINTIATSILIFVGLEALVTAETSLEVGIIGFALVYLLSEVSLFAYKNFIQPSARAIIKNYK